MGRFLYIFNKIGPFVGKIYRFAFFYEESKAVQIHEKRGNGAGKTRQKRKTVHRVRFHVWRLNSTRMGKISKRPSSISKERMILENGENSA